MILKKDPSLPGGNYRDIRRIPEAWLRMFDWFEANQSEALNIQCETARKAHNLRFEYYRVRKAVWDEEDLRALYPNLQRRGAFVRGSTLSFEMKDNHPMANAIEKALADWEIEKEASRGIR